MPPPEIIIEPPDDNIVTLGTLNAKIDVIGERVSNLVAQGQVTLTLLASIEDTIREGGATPREPRQPQQGQGPPTPQGPTRNRRDQPPHPDDPPPGPGVPPPQQRASRERVQPEGQSLWGWSTGPRSNRYHYFPPAFRKIEVIPVIAGDRPYKQDVPTGYQSEASFCKRAFNEVAFSPGSPEIFRAGVRVNEPCHKCLEMLLKAIELDRLNKEAWVTTRPTITSMNQYTGPAAGDQLVSIFGSGFMPVIEDLIGPPIVRAAKVKVWFGEDPALNAARDSVNVDVISDVEIQCRTPSGEPGYWFNQTNQTAIQIPTEVTVEVEGVPALPVPRTLEDFTTWSGDHRPGFPNVPNYNMDLARSWWLWT